jgi:hypothetical protein
MYFDALLMSPAKHLTHRRHFLFFATDVEATAAFALKVSPICEIFFYRLSRPSALEAKALGSLGTVHQAEADVFAGL